MEGGRKKMVNLKAILLTLMIGFDLSLHIVDLLNIVDKHPLYPIFPLLGFISYNIFWAIFWSIGFILSFLLIFSGVKVITKNYNTINIPKDDRISELQEELNKLEEK